ncbi:uncharacterized protein TRIADDRAFT_50723 [Trichoplax adhaerens]|uniref:phenylalanine--tRNA ligase n=1 Tax=Trichoplax adhaerens TaxID=10228 RepID=B3S5R3_TRIAD|nr:hypothetical protein TRIADDRAFT_50723 [Trichoplax adhaerens]EDV21943.1 hypothetical protein TRIADDRAFT_50723 [Trichoplax adhaerens]|eukprot:XP_002115580.1 hypothetical protein TRIADDRAFT_50723 [Trichoplax adhaerens]
MTNITPTISAKVGANLHCQRYHPLKAIKDHIEQYVHAIYRKRTGSPLFTCIDNLSPVVSVEQNFDSLSVPQDHVSRAKNDNYYINSDYLLRAHTSAHERDLVRAGLDAFLCTGDCYRRDEIDAKHYPVFHQMEGVRLFDKQDIFTKDKNLDIFDNSMQETEEKQAVHSLEAVKFVENDLKEILMGIMNNLFGNIETRFVDAYFPFTHPSWEMEIKFQGDWLEVLGCGIMSHNTLRYYKFAPMILFDIPDIRLFWSKDERFLSQFKVDDVISNVKFKPFSIHPPLYNDISFWLSPAFSLNNFCDVVRSVGGDLVEQVSLVDDYTDAKTGRQSHCYRLTYRSMDRTLTNEEMNVIQV